MVAPARGGFTVKARAVVGHYQADAVVHGGELDGQVRRPGMFVDVAKRLACRLVEEGRAVLRDLDAPVRGVPTNGGSPVAEGCREPVDAARQAQRVEVERMLIREHAVHGGDFPV